jgi:hypothetical protein
MVAREGPAPRSCKTNALANFRQTDFAHSQISAESAHGPCARPSSHARGEIDMNRSISVIAIGLLGITVANAQQETPPSSSASPQSTRSSQSSPKPAHGDHCQDPPNAASSGKTDCERTSPSDSNRQAESSSSWSSSRHSDSSSSSSRSTTPSPSSSSSTPRASPAPSSSAAPPEPVRSSDASSARAQTTPRPVEHEPPADGPESKSSASQPAPAQSTRGEDTPQNSTGGRPPGQTP